MSRAQHIGKQPRVVAVLTSLEALARFAKLKVKPCHFAEIRLDYIGHDHDWLPLCRKIEKAGTPVILTIRAAYEGGKWTGPEDERLKIFEKALREVSALDVELQSGFILTLSHHRPQVIVSYHNFAETPKLHALRSRAHLAFMQGADVVKIATMVNSPDDLAVLQQLLAEEWEGPLCVLGMGELGVKTRYEFLRRGSCLTYGYFEEPTAPGQPSAAALMELLG
jgi:3-dehydroquinate dehydratase-1